MIAITANPQPSPAQNIANSHIDQRDLPADEGKIAFTLNRSGN